MWEQVNLKVPSVKACDVKLLFKRIIIGKTPRGENWRVFKGNSRCTGVFIIVNARLNDGHTHDPLFIIRYGVYAETCAVGIW